IGVVEVPAPKPSGELNPTFVVATPSLEVGALALARPSPLNALPDGTGSAAPYDVPPWATVDAKPPPATWLNVHVRCPWSSDIDSNDTSPMRPAIVNCSAALEPVASVTVIVAPEAGVKVTPSAETGPVDVNV